MRSGDAKHDKQWEGGLTDAGQTALEGSSPPYPTLASNGCQQRSEILDWL